MSFNQNSAMNQSVLRRGGGNNIQTNKIQIGKPIDIDVGNSNLLEPQWSPVNARGNHHKL